MSRALVFDAYGTVFDPQSVQRRCEEFWSGWGAQLAQLWRAKQLEYTWHRSLMDRYAPFTQVTREALGYACEALGLALDEAKSAALMDEYLTLAVYPDVPAALERLRGEGRKLAILTNGSPDMIMPLLKNRGLEKTFDAVLSVDELRIYKPAPDVYRLAVERLTVEPGEIGFVSSNCWDALGAKSFGFYVYWINRSGAPADRTGFAPDQVIGSAADVR
jgi:2-haloacid dehalogenase